MATKKTKTTKAANDSTPSAPLLDSAWQNFWGLADDTRAELHKQTEAVIALADGVFRGATSYAEKLNNRVDIFAQEALLAASRTGRELALAGQSNSKKLIDSSYSSATSFVQTTRESARDIAERANATARAIVTPSKAA
jgi:hypothetical protein